MPGQARHDRKKRGILIEIRERERTTYATKETEKISVH
jgi:hypothetical protein